MTATGALGDDLRRAWGETVDSWHATRGGWRDSVAHEFEREFWAELERSVPWILNEIDSFHGAVAEAHQRVEYGG